jgi:opacity protein-like surface antigen
MRVTTPRLAAILIAATGAASAQTMPTGFYVRGDLGGGFAQNATFTDVDPTAPNCDLCGFKFPATINSSVLFGGGLGYRFSPLLRADVTADDLPSFRLRGTSTQPGNPSGSAPFSSLVVMANGYLDLDALDPTSFGPFRPYVTAGLGVARNALGTFSAAFTTGPLAGVGVSEAGVTRTNFAWGAGAGIGYPVAPTVTLDLAYKYLDLGELRTGTTYTVMGTLIAATASKSSDLNVHTIIASLRIGF